MAATLYYILQKLHIFLSYITTHNVRILYYVTLISPYFLNEFFYTETRWVKLNNILSKFCEIRSTGPKFKSGRQRQPCELKQL
jgi:hypothetical protein